MMISPEAFVFENQDKTYQELIKERDKIIRELRKYEKGDVTIQEMLTTPSAHTRYICNLEYLSALCPLIAEKFNEKDE